MATRPQNSEVTTLELYRVAFENAEKQTEISKAMAQLGYDAKKLDEGKALLTQTRSAFDVNKAETDETSAASAAFSAKKTELENLYALHRKKAKVVFRSETLTADKLAITGEMPRTYINWLETTKKFYTVATADNTIQTKLARLAITPAELSAGKKLITDVEAARAEYLKEVGESQDATKAKDAAFAKMDNWMSEFYAVARIALEDNPQLLEALGKVVKG